MWGGEKEWKWYKKLRESRDGRERHKMRVKIYASVLFTALLKISHKNPGFLLGKSQLRAYNRFRQPFQRLHRKTALLIYGCELKQLIKNL